MTVSMMREPASRVYRGADAVARLAEMGLQAAWLREAVERGDDRRQMCTELHPRTYPGQVMWGETTEALRRKLIGSGRGDWAPGRLRNYETVFSAEAGLSIVIAGGDTHTGVVDDQDPAFVRRRGPVTAKRLQRNRSMQLALPSLEVDEPAEETGQLWILLINARHEQIFLELSLGVGSDHRPAWPERILFDAIPRSGVTPVAEPDDEGDDPVVSVARR